MYADDQIKEISTHVRNFYFLASYLMPSSPINATHTNSTTIITHKRQQLHSQQAGCLLKCVVETYIFGLKCLTVKNSSSTPFTAVLAKCVLHTTVGTYLPFYEKKYIDSKVKNSKFSPNNRSQSHCNITGITGSVCTLVPFAKNTVCAFMTVQGTLGKSSRPMARF